LAEEKEQGAELMNNVEVAQAALREPFRTRAT
jgi:hypothetical protein